MGQGRIGKCRRGGVSENAFEQKVAKVTKEERRRGSVGDGVPTGTIGTSGICCAASLVGRGSVGDGISHGDHGNEWYLRRRVIGATRERPRRRSHGDHGNESTRNGSCPIAGDSNPVRP